MTALRSRLLERRERATARRIELEFHPPALEIQDRPPLPASRWLLWLIVVFFTVAVVWSVVGRVEIVGVAPGRIVPSGRVKIIQPVDTARVDAIHVREGDRVASGAVLIELNAADTAADLARFSHERGATALQAARLQALLATPVATVTPDAPAAAGVDAASVQVAEYLDAAQAIPAPAIAAVQAHYQQLAGEYRAERAALAGDLRRNRAADDALTQRIRQLDETIPLITERATAVADLIGRKLAPRSQWLDLEQARIERTRERDIQAAQRAVLDAEWSGLRERLAKLDAERRAAWLAELIDARTRLAGYDEELAKARQRQRQRTLAAPVAGTVQQLAVHTVGGVVTPAQALMLIVPEQDALQIEAWIPNRDIGFVHAGQRATIKIETFEFTKYGTLDGTLARVSHDAVAQQDGSLVYAAEVELAATHVRVDGRDLGLSPGMAVTVDIHLGTRRLIEYLLAPLLRYKNESARER
jgi:hemolysin D